MQIRAAFPALMMVCAILSFAALAQSRGEAEDGGDSKPGGELEIKLPAPPKAENLLPFEGGAASGNRFFVDAQSILVGDDGVVRYTLVIKSASGAENVSYEGMHCDNVEQKYYAFGRRDGTWTNAQSSTWKRIQYKEINRQHGVLYADYFCPDGSPIRSAKDAVNRFKYGVPKDVPPRGANKR